MIHLRPFSSGCLKAGFFSMPSLRALIMLYPTFLISPECQWGIRPHLMGCTTHSHSAIISTPTVTPLSTWWRDTKIGLKQKQTSTFNGCVLWCLEDDRLLLLKYICGDHQEELLLTCVIQELHSWTDSISGHQGAPSTLVVSTCHFLDFYIHMHGKSDLDPGY